MKRRFSKILGVGLAVVLALALTVVLVPANTSEVQASPAAGSWNAFKLPAGGGPGGYVYQAAFTNAQYITKAIDGTLYCYDNDATATQYLFKSTDDGRSWGRVGGALMKGKELVDIATSSKDTNTLWVATSTTIYVSTNAATGFSALVANADMNTGAGAVITSIDAGYVGDTAYIFMATADSDTTEFGGLYVLGPAYGANWSDLQITDVNNAIATEETVVDVYDIAVMPDFGTSQGLVAVVAGSGGTVYSVTKYAGANWGANVNRATLGVAAPLTTAQIAFPDDFSSVTTSGLMEYFVGVDAEGSRVGTTQDVVDGTAAFSTTAKHSGNYSVKLYDGGATNSAARVVIPAPMSFASITSLSYWFNYSAASGSPAEGAYAFPYMILAIDTGGGTTPDEWIVLHSGGDPYQPAEGVWVQWNLAAWDKWFDATGANIPDFSSLATAQTAYSGADLVEIKVAVGEGWAVGVTGYVDDVEINGTTYSFEEGDGDVFRTVLANALDRNIAGAGTATAVTGLDVVGNVGTGHLIAGSADALSTYVSTDNSGTWTKSKKHPVGAGFAAWIVMADDFATSGKAWAATSGVGGGVYLSVDSGLEWNGVGLLDVNLAGGTIQDFAIGGSETVFVAIAEAGGSEDLWRHDGTNWEQIYADQLGNAVDMVACTDTFATDSTVFIASTTTKQIARSSDGGGRWANQLGKPTAINSWLIQSSSAMLVGGASTVHQTTNNGTTWNNRAISTLGAIMSFAKSPEYADDETVVCGDNGGKVARSVNAGTSWAQIPAGAGALGSGGNTYVAFNQEDATMVYAVEDAAAGSIFRHTFGTASWLDINNIAYLAPRTKTGGTGTASTLVAAGSTGIVCAPDGTLYVADPSANVGMCRSINPTAARTPASAAPFFEAVSTGLTTGQKTASRLIYTPGSNKIWMFDNTVSRRLYYYEDACSSAVTGLGVTPVTSSIVMLTWDAVDSVTSYTVWYNRDALAWAGATNTTSSTNALRVTDLGAGATYRWRICVADGSPALSPWAETQTFVMAMTTMDISTDYFGPALSAEDVQIRPAFAWQAITGATSYEFELADNPNFTGATAKTLTSPVYQWETDLEYSTTYYWRVKAVSATSESSWATGTFTTEAMPEEAAEEEPSPLLPYAEMIPMFAWLVIGVGAVLVIAVIILIVRTRRVS